MKAIGILMLKAIGILLLVIFLTILSYVIAEVTGPHFFVEADISLPQVAHVREGARTHQKWANSPVDCALQYSYFGSEVDPYSRYVSTRVTKLCPVLAIVDVFDSSGDDSISFSCDRFTMHLEDGAWVPIRHQMAWQGRGHIGWTTEPCL